MASAQTSSSVPTLVTSFPTLLDGLPGSQLSLNHLAVDTDTGMVYLATVNGLYQLNADLAQMQRVYTGPELDSPICGPGVALEPQSTAAQRCKLKSTNAVNKALVIDKAANRIIVCSNLYQGLCQLRQLEDVSKLLYTIRNETVVGNDETSSTFAFIAPGPMSKNVLMVGVTYTGLGPFNSEVPAVSSRSLAPPLFKLAHKGISKGTEFKVNAAHQNEYKIKYKYGFHHKEFSYFVTVQRDGLGSNHYITRLVRVCQSDDEYSSYTELRLSCGSAGTNYNVLQAAFFGNAGQDLASSLRIDPDNNNNAVLFGVFSVGQSDPYNDIPTSKSALCVYSMKAIRRAFRNGIKKCFSGEGSSGINFNRPLK
jgi:plexin A